LAWAEGYREAPYQLHAASCAVVFWPGDKPEAYRLALRQMEAACRLELKNGGFLTILGMAQYRATKYAEAMETLTEADRINSDVFLGQGSIPSDLAFLAMTQHQLGHKERAVATLARLREAMKEPGWAHYDA
jgi:hypothetical protein